MYNLGVADFAVATDPAFKPGSIAADSDGKIYKYVQYKEATNAVAGGENDVAYYYTLDGYRLNQVTSDVSDSVDIGAGVIPNGVTPEEDEWFWIQIKGPATLSQSLTSGTDGDALTPTGAGDGRLAVSTAAADHVCAYAGDASDSEIICDFPF